MKKHLQLPSNESIMKPLVEETENYTQMIDSILTEATKGILHKLFEGAYIYLPIIYESHGHDGRSGPVPEDPTTIYLVTLDPVDFIAQTFSIADIISEEISNYITEQGECLKPLIAIKNKLMPLLNQIEQLERKTNERTTTNHIGTDS